MDVDVDADQLRRQGRLLEPEAWERCTLFDVNHRPTHMSPEELAVEYAEVAESADRLMPARSPL